MAHALQTFLPSARVHGVAAGLHLLVTFEQDLDDAELAAQLLDTGIKVHPLSWHRQLPGPPAWSSATREPPLTRSRARSGASAQPSTRQARAPDKISEDLDRWRTYDLGPTGRALPLAGR
jgi:DNA-binding transcriptional MocR family regulator